MRDDGYKPMTPGINDTGWNKDLAIDKPLARGSLDNGDRGTPVPHATMPNKVLPTAHIAPPAREIQAPAYTSGKPSKPAGRPLPSTGRR